MRQRRKKNQTDILTQNLIKMGAWKHRIADSEELWLDFFQDAVPMVIQETGVGIKAVEQATAIANAMLDAYEARWGKIAG